MSQEIPNLPEIPKGLEETLIIVKPDGMKKGLIGEIVRRINQAGLFIDYCTFVQLQPGWAENLYAQEKGEIYYKEVVDWVSSAPVLLMKVNGPQAVKRVKWDIIGRYPNGIRGEHAENWIQNVAHAPDSIESAKRELALAEEIFEMRKRGDKERFKGKKVFALTGMSESGKSTVGKYLESKGMPRLKIGSIFERVRDKMAPGLDLQEFVKREEGRNPFSLWDGFIDELLQVIEEKGVDIVSIESLYGGGLGTYLKQRMGKNFDIVYVDIPLEVRLQRQMIRENLSTIVEAEQLLLPRDEIKTASGIPDLKNLAGEILDNSGTIENLYRQLDNMVARHIKIIREKDSKK